MNKLMSRFMFFWVFLSVLSFAIVTSSAYAATFIVDSTSDVVDASPGDGSCDDGSGNCTLRAAIMEANALSGADTITLPAGTYTLTITGVDEDSAATGDLDITTDITINGDGSSTTVIDANGIDRVFQVPSVGGASATLNNLKVTGGDSTASTVQYGGGISATKGLTLNNVVVDNNAGGTSGGGVYCASSCFLTDSTVSNNTVNGDGAGVYGGYYGYLVLRRSTVSGNTTGNARYGGGIFSNCPIDISYSTISGNTAYKGGGIYLSDGTGNISSLAATTITNNASTHSTGQGGGLYLYQTLLLDTYRTLIAGNGETYSITTPDLYIDDINSDFGSSGCNLIGNIGNSATFTEDTDDQVGTSVSPIDAKLDVLADNGGATQTHALLSGSPAIDGCSSATGAGTDQRGVSGPVDGDSDGTATWDIGSYEFEPSPSFTVSAISGDTGEDGTTATFTVKLNTQPTANVTIGVSSSDTGEGTVDKSSLTFTSTNWNANQTVTVTGINDDLVDGDQAYTIVLGAASSTDGNYDNLNPSDVSVTC